MTVLGIFDGVMGKKEEQKEQVSAQVTGKYSQACTLCGNPGTEKKWAGKFWHNKCLRRSKKMAKGML